MANLHRCSVLCKQLNITGRKSPGDEAESASLKGQDLLLSPCKRLTQGQLAIATVICANGETTHQLNGAYSCTDAPALALQAAASIHLHHHHSKAGSYHIQVYP